MWEFVKARRASVLGVLLTLTPIISGVKWLWDWLGRIDLVVGHMDDLKAVWTMVAAPPPWLNLILVVLGIGLIWWDLRHGVRSTSTAKADIYDISVLDFLKLGPQYGWDFREQEGFLYLDMQDALADAAANGLIKVWGRKVPPSFPSSILNTVPLTEVPQDFWASGVLVRVPINMKGELLAENRGAIAQRGFDDKERYEDLHLAKHEAFQWARGHGARFKGKQWADHLRKNA